MEKKSVIHLFSSPVFDCLQNGDPWSVSGPQLGLLHQRHDHEPQSPEGRVSRVRGRNGGHCRPHAQTHQEVRRPFFLSDSVPLSVTSLEPRVQSVRFHSLPRLLRVPLPRNSLVASWPADGLPFPTSCFCDRLARMCAVDCRTGETVPHTASHIRHVAHQLGCGEGRKGWFSVSCPACLMTRGAHCAFVSGFHRFSFAGEMGKHSQVVFFSEFIGWFWNKIKKIKKIGFLACFVRTISIRGCGNQKGKFHEISKA